MPTPALQPRPAADVAVIIVNYRSASLTQLCVESLAGVALSRVLIVDNASGDGSVEQLEAGLKSDIAVGRVEILPQTVNGGFGWGNNQALRHLARGDSLPRYVWLLNPDCAADGQAADALYQALEGNADCAIAGSQLLNPDASLSGSAFRFPTIGREFADASGIAALGRLLGIAPTLVPIGQAGIVDWVTGASFMARWAALRECGIFDEGYFLYFEEVDLMHRLASRGWSIRHVPESRVTHIGGASTGIRDGEPVATRALPLYWFQSRHRFFRNAYGARYAFFADLARSLGQFVRIAVGMVAPHRSAQSAFSLANMWQVRQSTGDAGVGCTSLDDPIGQPPLWLERPDRATGHAVS